MKVIVVFTLVALGCIVGCSGGGAVDSDGQPAPEGGPATSQAEPDVTMAVQINKIVGDDETTQSLDMFPDPDVETVNKQVKAIDWTNSQLRPTVALGRTVDGTIRNLAIKGTIGTPNVDGEFRAYWMGLVDDDVAFRKSPALESVETGIELLLLFCNEDEKLDSVVLEWEDAE